jgi:DNA-binding transcriptional MocR family regulator
VPDGWSEPSTQVRRPAGLIDLGVGQPQDAILPVALMARAMMTAAASGRHDPLQYGAERGDGRLRAALARFLSVRYGAPVDPAHLLVSNGNSHAIELCCGVFTQPGDVVLVEDPTYFLALRIFADHGLRVVGVPVDDDGIRLDALEEALVAHAPRLLYVIPTGQNPTGSTMPVERRRRLVALAREHGTLVLADEVYQLLDFTGATPEPLAAQADSGGVLSLGTFSKILAPGLRLGWVQASEDLLDVLAARGQLRSGGGVNPFTSAVVAPVLEDGGVDGYLDELLGVLRGRSAAMDAALREHPIPGATYRRPRAGYFFWLRLPDDVDTTAALPAALAAGAGFQPGPASSTSGSFRSCLRLAFSYYDEADIRRGVQRLRGVFS